MVGRGCTVRHDKTHKIPRGRWAPGPRFHLPSESAYLSEFTMILHIFRLREFAILCHMNFTGDEFHNCEIHAFNIGESCDFHSFSHAITVVEFTRFTLDFTMNHLG